MSLFDKEKELSAGNKGNLKYIAAKLMSMSEAILAEPFDPKIAAHLRMASDLAEEQMMLNKYYTYPKTEEESDYKFLSQDDTVDKTHAVNEPKPEPEPEPEPTSEPESNITDDGIHKWLDGLEGD